MEKKDFGFETNMVHAGYCGKNEATRSTAVPLYQTNAYSLDNVEHAANLFNLSESGNIYSRLMNPTCSILEEKVAVLDGGVAALAFASGHAAIFNMALCLCSEGDEIVASTNIYGGAINMLGITLKRIGINTIFVNPDKADEWENAVTDKTKLFFTEIVGNPNANVSDIEMIAEIAHKHGVPFAVDSTFTTPYLCRPIEFGADFVVHSATKYLGGHGTVMGGIVVDSGNFEFKNNPRFPLYNEPDESYHGVVFADLGKTAFITRLRVLTMRDLGACLAPANALNLIYGIETLALRMERHCENALKVAKFLENHEKVAKVNCPMLENNEYYHLAQKYCPKGSGGVFTFELKGGKAAGISFLNNLSLMMIVANVADVRSIAVHPASTTHSQLSEEQLVEAGITGGTVRLSIGIETADDIIDDIAAALEKV